MTYKQKQAGSIVDEYKDKKDGLSTLGFHIVRHVRAFEVSPDRRRLEKTDVHDMSEGYGSTKVSEELQSLFRKNLLKQTKNGLCTTEKARQKL
jgi:hypothetical protein